MFDPESKDLETPPRTWRRRSRASSGRQNRRNTSTDVEKTFANRLGRRHPRKHLHGRGEDWSALKNGLLAVETPPRTWRRPILTSGVITNARNTSTDVEKTLRRCAASPLCGKHLHGRGEDLLLIILIIQLIETPPRTWRRLSVRLLRSHMVRNTSTDVEKTARFSVRLIQPTLLFVVVVVKGGSLTN